MPVSTIRPITTEYAGYRFRSRLEARWAVFLDALALRWDYELEGFEGDGVRYLPDFWLPELSCWLEIKPEWPSEQEFEKATLPIKATGFPLFIAIGVPSKFTFEPPRTRDGINWTKELASGELIEVLSSGDWIRCRGFCECRCCLTPKVGIGAWATEFRGGVTCTGVGPASPRIRRAYEAAKSARFEFLPRNMRRALEGN